VLDQKWLNDALRDTEATSRGEGSVDATISKNGMRVVVRGRITAPLSMPCARTLDPVEVDIDAELMLVLSPARSAIAAPQRKRARKKSELPPGGFAAKGHKAEVDRTTKEREISAEEAAEDVYSGTEIALDEFVREYIILELPMAPMRSDLRAQDKPAIPAPPEDAIADAGKQIDPRLAPLAAVAVRLKHEKE
jgi:uncharacterized metal-binding protein YceD (DUF177 family)